MSNYSEPSEISKLFVCVCFYICIVPHHLPVQCATSLPSTWYRYCTTSLFSAVCHLTSQYMVQVLYHVTFQCSVLPHFPVHGIGIVPRHFSVQCATSLPSTWYWYCIMSLASAVCHLSSQCTVFHHCLQSCQINFISNIWENIISNSCFCVI